MKRDHGPAEPGRYVLVAALIATLGTMPEAHPSTRARGALSQVEGQNVRQAIQQDPACQSLTPAAAGGPLPRNDDTLVVRWLGHTNYELAYRGNVFLLDAYYERLPRSHPIGLAPAAITRATAIFIGHAHFDHMADAGSVAARTGAAVVGASFARDVLSKAGVPARQFIAVKGGERQEWPGVTADAVLGHHNVIASTVPEGFLERQQGALQAAALQTPLSEAETKQAEAVRARGSRDPGIATAGVVNYLLTFDGRFRVLFADSPGPITGAERAIAQQVPGVDVAMLPYVNFEAGIPPLVDLATTFKPATVFLGHHDGAGTMLWASNYPAAYAIRRVLPQTRTLDVLYRTPVCFNTTTRDMVIGW
ncbi:MAG: MBL fold metallo-hydrolase [Acidobacteria bacterium]|nr:MBL fold metallo-hydrolase [Acidobacteriota bacterium]